MEIIDENGRLFGVINVIDALAILLVVAVVVAGIAVVDPFSRPDTVNEPAVRYGTIELQDQPAFVGGLIQTGDRMKLETSGENLTITDTYVAPGTQNDVSVTLRVALRGTESRSIDSNQSEFTFGGSRLRIGETIRIITRDYDVNGTLRTIEPDTDRLQTRTSKVVVEATVPQETANTIQVGDTYRISGTPVGVIQSKYLLPGGDAGAQRLFLGIEFETIAREESQRFGDRSLNIGSPVSFRTTDYDVQGRIIQHGTTEINTTEIPVVIESEPPTSLINNINVGDSYRLNDQTIATINSVSILPNGGQIDRRALIGMTLEAVERDGTLRFAGRQIKVGSTIPFSTDDYDITGQVIRLRDQQLPGHPTETTVVLKLSNIDPEFADGIRTGMTEMQGGTANARISEKRTEHAGVILKSEDGNIFEREHPRNKDVYLTVTLQTRETSSGLTFHARPLQEGIRITLDLGSITIDGAVIELT